MLRRGGPAPASPALAAAGPPTAAPTVLGLDPGSRHFGWGVIRRAGTKMVHVAHGVIDTSLGGSFGDRLVELETELVKVVAVYQPTHASVEGLFFAKDAQAAAKLGHARGVALLVCARAGLPVAEYPPARVKMTVAGAGRADKSQVAQMVRVVLALREVPRADAADALAVALTHLADTRLGAALRDKPPGPSRRSVQ